MINTSRTINASIGSKGEVDSYSVAATPGSIISVTASSQNANLFPLLELRGIDGSLLKNPLAYNGSSADLGIYELGTGNATVNVKAQGGRTGDYTLNISIYTLEELRSEVIRLTNIERVKAGRPPLVRNSLLEQAAQSHVRDMDASNRYLAHTGSNGSTPTTRINATGYKSAWFNEGNGVLRTVPNENVAAFSGSFSATHSATQLAAQVVQAWMNSAGHRAAILDAATKEIGVGFEYDIETGQWYWAQTFGFPWAPGLVPLEVESSTITLALPLASVAEDGTTNLVYTFTRSGPTTSALTVNFTVGGTATLGSDYTGIATAGTTKQVTFAAGSATATVIVDPTTDTTLEANETVALTLATGAGYNIGTPSAVTGTIANDDITLYNSATGRPNEQGWLAFGGTGGSQTRSTNGTTLTSSTNEAVGYSNRNVVTPTLVNSAFPTLNRSVGFSVDFRLRLISESHVPNNRAGFSVILLDQGPTPRGIELGFWSTSIFSQKGGSTPFQAIGESINAFATTAATSYSLRILDQAYYLLANNRLVLSGSVQDYSLWPKDPLLPYNPYTTPNLLFLGDNTRSAAASVELGTISLGVAVTGTNAADTTTGTAAADTFNGLDGADQLNGGDGNDWLAGGAGTDILNGDAGDDFLIGGSQADRFLFSSGAIFNASQLGVDTLVDFNPAEDRLRLARSTFTALDPGSSLSAGSLAVVTSDAAAATSSATIAYNSANGCLFYNPNGTAAGFAATTPAGGGLFAQLQGTSTGVPFPTLTSSAFEIV